MENKNNKKENHSMYLYTALIFVVALLLIIVSFFSQTNISKLGNRANEFAAETPAVTETPSADASEDLARISNMAATLDTENKNLKAQLEIYEKLADAIVYINTSNQAEAQALIDTIDQTLLSDKQRMFYDEIKTKLNEGKDN